MYILKNRLREQSHLVRRCNDHVRTGLQVLHVNLHPKWNPPGKRACLLHVPRSQSERHVVIHTCLMMWGSLMRQRALHKGSLMEAPCFSSWVANPPSMTAHPPAFSIKSLRADPLVFFPPTPITPTFSSAPVYNLQLLIWGNGSGIDEGWMEDWPCVFMPSSSGLVVWGLDRDDGWKGFLVCCLVGVFWNWMWTHSSAHIHFSYHLTSFYLFIY